MAYKNQKKNKAKVAELKKTGWRATNRKEAQQRRHRNYINTLGVSDQKEIESIMRMQGLI